MRTSALLLALLLVACGDDDAGSDAAVDSATSDTAVDSAMSDVSSDALDSSVDAPTADVAPDAPLEDSAVADATPDAGGGFVDEFDGDELVGWMRRHEVEGTDAQYTRLEVSGGALIIVPTRTPGWFADGDAPLVFRNVDGDFLAEADVVAGGVAGAVPASNFNSAGLMARNAAGADGPENHIMVNVGRQDGRIEGGVGSETKTTVDSSSVLTLNAGQHEGRVRLCRVGDVFVTLVRYEGDAEWNEIGRNTRADLPATLQVGMVANGFAGPDLEARFEYFQMRAPSSAADCALD